MKYYQITDAAKKVNVESHVLRYWEDELKLPIERNKQGHRLYTEEDLNRFLYIKELKKEGLQLRAIRARIHKAEDWAKAGNPDKGYEERAEREQGQNEKVQEEGNIELLDCKEQSGQDEGKRYLYAPGDELMRIQVKDHEEDRQEKALKLCMMLQQMVGQAVKKENKEMMLEMKKCVAETVSKEMDYQFRMQEQREEEHFKRVDELLRLKSGRKSLFQKNNEEAEAGKTGSCEAENKQEAQETEKSDVKKRGREKRRNKKTKAERDKELLMENKRRTPGV